jgi:5-methylcytosine-specific restriction endonuclease McrA
MLRKARPKALDRSDRKAAELRYYKSQRAIAMTRDGHHCRICGGIHQLETHHVQPRSHFGPKRVQHKHDAMNLLTVCHDCHVLLTGNVLRAYATTDKGAGGPVKIWKYSDSEGGYIVYRERA